MWRWLIAAAVAVKLLYSVAMAAWVPITAPPPAAPARPIVVCESSTGPITCFEVEAAASPVPGDGGLRLTAR